MSMSALEQTAFGGPAQSPFDSPLPGDTPSGAARDPNNPDDLGPRNTAADRPANESSGYTPSGPETALLVRELFIRAREARRALMIQWKRSYMALNNRQYKPGASPWEEEPAVSNIWPTVASATAWMTDQRPTLEVTPTSEPFNPYWDFYEQLARDMNVVLAANFANYDLDGEITKVLWDVHTYGIGYFKTTWEPWLADGLGDSVFRRCDPFTIYADPHAHDMADCSYIIEAKTMTIADIDRAWPGAARMLSSATWLEDSDEAPHKLDHHVRSGEPRVALGALAPATTPRYGTTTGSGPAKPTDAPVVTVLEAWIRGHRTEKTADPAVTDVYDEWRCVVVVGDYVIMDAAASELSGFNTHPYDRMVLFDTGEWYGPSIVELLTPIQRVINWLLASINRNIYLMGNPVLVEDPRSASRNKRFTNRPGQRLEGDARSVQWMNPPTIHPQMSVELIRYYEGKIETISGLSAMVRGFSPSGRNSEGVLDSVQDAAFVRVRASLRELERALRGVASKQAANIGEFYIEPRLQSIIGPDGIKTHMALQARHFYSPPDEMGTRIPLRFSIAADAGSQLPTSKQARAAEAKHLFTIGAIDVFELLKAIQWPSYAVVAQRVMAQQAAMAGED